MLPILLCALTLATPQNERFETDLLPPGATFPAGEFVLLSGAKINFPRDYSQATAAVVAFWAIGSPAAIPHLQELESLAQSRRDIKIYFVNHADTSETIRQTLSEQKLRTPCLLVQPGPDSLTQKAGVKAFPTTYILAPDGKVLARAFRPAPGLIASLLPPQRVPGLRLQRP